MLLSITLAAVPAIVSPAPTGPAAPAPSTDDAAALVRLRAQDRVDLAASYFQPHDMNDRSPAAVLVHDAGADRTQLADLAAYLNKRGFGVLTLDVRGHGESATDGLRWESLDEKERARAWALASRDLDTAMTYLREKPEIHSANFSLVGIGAGCQLVVRHAVDDENVRAVVLIDPPQSALGYDLSAGIRALEGLPCLLVSSKAGREAAEKLQTSAHEANDGLEYIEVQVMKASSEKLLEDKRLNNSSATWLRKQVLPQGKK